LIESIDLLIELSIDSAGFVPSLRRRLRQPALICRTARHQLKGRKMTHRFRPGQSVRFCHGSPYRDAAEGSYEVIRQLPQDNADYQYRIKSAREEHERVVKEHELELA
jgi:hypothetical protein